MAPDTSSPSVFIAFVAVYCYDNRRSPRSPDYHLTSNPATPIDIATSVPIGPAHSGPRKLFILRRFTRGVPRRVTKHVTIWMTHRVTEPGYVVIETVKQMLERDEPAAEHHMDT